MLISPLNSTSFRGINYYEVDTTNGEANFFYEKSNPNFIKKNMQLGKRYHLIMQQIKKVQEEVFDIEYTMANYKTSKEIYEDMKERLQELSIKMKRLKEEKRRIDNIVPDIGCLGDRVESVWVLDKNGIGKGARIKRN